MKVLTTYIDHLIVFLADCGIAEVVEFGALHQYVVENLDESCADIDVIMISDIQGVFEPNINVGAEEIG